MLTRHSSPAGDWRDYLPGCVLCWIGNINAAQQTNCPDVISDRKEIDIRMQTSDNLKKRLAPSVIGHYLGLSEEFLEMLR